MEQTNLVVTPDGKSWDEVTRDVSYIGGQDVVARATSTSNVADSVNSTHKFNEIRGLQQGTDCGNKNWTIAYDRWICLVGGNYLIHYTSLLQGAEKAGDQLVISINGIAAGQSYFDGTGYEMGTSTVVNSFIRGDYVQIFGAVWDGDHSSFTITRV